VRFGAIMHLSPELVTLPQPSRLAYPSRRLWEKDREKADDHHMQL